MKRKEYMERLEQLLLVLPEEEREEALQYYNDYFDDAGVEKEEQVMKELGSPEEVAAKIRAGYGDEYGEYSEQGYEDLRFQEKREDIVKREEFHDGWEKIQEEEIEKIQKNRNTKNLWKIIVIGLLLIFAVPVILPLGISVIVVIMALMIAAMVTLVALGISGLAALVAGGLMIVTGIAKTVVMPAAGILAAGIGAVFMAVGIFLSWLIIVLTMKILPMVLRGMVDLLRKLFRKEKNK